MSRCSLCTGQEGERSAARSPAAIRPRRPARHEPRKGKAALWPASACDRKGQREKKNGPIAARLFFACHSGKNKKYRKKIHVIRRRIGRAAQRARATFSPFFSFDAYANKKFAAYTAADLSASGSGIRRTALHFCFHAALFGLEVRQGRRKNPHSNQCDPAGSRPARQLGRTNSDRNRETTHNNNAHRFKKK